MLIYTGTKRDFSTDVMNNTIADKIEKSFYDNKFSHNNTAEYRSWENSLRCMQLVLNDNAINDDCKIAIEYKIPMTSKRVDFIITGKDSNNNDNVVIVELKQWEKAKRTNLEDLVYTYVGGQNRNVTHPSYQAYSYAKTIENFNESISQSDIIIQPCAFLHNYQEEYRTELDNNFYEDAVKLAPIFIKTDFSKLREFIKRFICKADNGEILYKIEYGRIKPSKVLQDSLASMMRGNIEFLMIDEQKVAFSTIKDLVEKAVKGDKKHTVIVQGGPGTGKSVIAINLLVELRNLNINYVTKNSAPRQVYFSKLRKDKFKLNYIKNLFKGSGAYIDCESNTFDCLVVDEAHRLNEKSGLFAKGENQIKEIINASKVSVFFIDEDQVVTAKDIGSVNQIAYWADQCNSELHFDDDLKLLSQFRCNGSDGYISFLDDVLQIRKTANYDGFEMEYDLKVYDDVNILREDLRKKNAINNKARLLAGYCYEWVTKNDTRDDLYDINLEGGFQAKWNFSNTTTWAIDSNTFDQVGCIHTSQGLEFDYVGVIIGKDLRYENRKVITDYTKRAKTDKSLYGFKKKGGLPLADKIIRNTYKTLLSRGQKGCYIYCEDKALANYLKSKINK